MAKQKTYQLTPSWKYFFAGYVLSVLTIPILVGIIAFYYVHRKHRSIRYLISDDDIRATDGKYEHHVDLVDIQGITVSRTWLQRQLGIGSLVLETSASTMKLRGLEEAETIKAILNEGIKAAAKQQEERQKTTPEDRPADTGSRQQLEYLTGLWQQGLLSEEDYREERRKLN